MEEKQNTVDKNQGDLGRANFSTDEAAIREREEKVSNRRGSFIDKDEGNMHHGTLGGNFDNEQVNNEESENK